jgi:tRNA pseudouridine32 synthase/23S rRNA pseudouridine746 synthase
VTADLEALTLARLAELEKELAACDVAGAREALASVEAEVAAVAQERRDAVRVQRQQRGLARRAGVDVTAAAEEAMRANHAASALELERVNGAKRLVREREETRRVLRESRRQASATLMAAMFDGMALTSARGERRGLRQVFVGGGIPSGTAECAAPKLLNAANVAGLRPLALAEAWWGPSQNGRNHGDLQAPCTKCLPILGHLLCGTEER